MVTVETCRRILEVIEDYHPRYGDDWMSASRIKRKLAARGWETHWDQIVEACEFLTEVEALEKGFSKCNVLDHHFTTYRLKEEKTYERI